MKKVLLLIATLVMLCSVFSGCSEKAEEQDTTTTTQSVIESSSTTETTTETTTEKKIETTTIKKVEKTTKKPETTTKKPNKTETTTKKPVTTTKPSKPETTTKPGEKHTENAADLSDSELERIWNEVDCNTEAEYKAYVKNIPNYKCKWCGDHNCPSITYGPNRIGDIVVTSLDKSKCPAIKAEKIKCPQGCGRILVDDDRWFTQPDKYCDGTCHLNFG